MRKLIGKIKCFLGLHKFGEWARDEKLPMCVSSTCKRCGDTYIKYGGSHI